MKVINKLIKSIICTLLIAGCGYWQKTNALEEDISFVIEMNGEKSIFYKIEGDGLLYRYYSSNGTYDEYYRFSNKIYLKTDNGFEH